MREIIRISLLIVRISFENSERIIIIYRASISAFFWRYDWCVKMCPYDWKIIDRFYLFKNRIMWFYMPHSMFGVSMHREQRTGCYWQLFRKNDWNTWCCAPEIFSKKNWIIKKKIRLLRRKQNSSQYVEYRRSHPHLVFSLEGDGQEMEGLNHQNTGVCTPLVF